MSLSTISGMYLVPVKALISFLFNEITTQRYKNLQDLSAVDCPIGATPPLTTNVIKNTFSHYVTFTRFKALYYRNQ